MGGTTNHKQFQAGRSDAETHEADAFSMKRSVELAWSAAGRTGANPLVGAVVTNDGRIVGEGCHEAYGQDHAEVVALDEAGDLAVGGTLFSTLEPCVHYGKTPPCVERILASGVRRVVVGTLDPDARMNGAGIDALRARGLRVDAGTLWRECVLLNMGYLKRTLGLGQTITLKMAVTLDGRIASSPGSRDTISGADARRFVHGLRALNDGVLVGITTLLVDKPRLDCRDLDLVDAPVPIVLGGGEKFPTDYPWIHEKRPFLVLSAEAAPVVTDGGGQCLLCSTDEAGKIELNAALSALLKKGFESILVEGGREVLTSFIGQSIWDVLHVIVAPRTFGDDGVGLAAAPMDIDETASLVGCTKLAEDALLSYIRNDTLDALEQRVVPKS